MDKGLKPIAVLEIISGTGVILFWLLFFTVGLAPKNPPECYFVFEHSFPLPDITLSIVAIAAGLLLLKDKPIGYLLSLPAAGAFVFLGLLDFSFNIQNRMYCLGSADFFLNAFINIWCVGFGIFVIVRMIKIFRQRYGE